MTGLHSLTSLRRYRRACAEIAPGQEPQCWMAETEIGEAWRAMPRWLRVWLLLVPRPHLREALAEVATPAAPPAPVCARLGCQDEGHDHLLRDWQSPR